MTDVDHAPAALKFAARLAWRFLAVTAAVAVIALAIAKLTVIVVPASLALLVATQLLPPVFWLRKHGWPRGLATTTVFLLGVGLIVATAVVVIPAFLAQQDALVIGLQHGVEQVSAWLATGPLGLPQDLVQRSLDRIGSDLSANAETILGGVFNGAAQFVEVIFGTLLTLFLLFFFLLDGELIWDWLVGLFPQQHEALARTIGSRAWRALAGYVRGVVVVACTVAIAIGVTLRLVGAPLALPLSVITFLGALIPILGLPVAGALAALIALVTRGPIAAAVVVVVVIVMAQLEGPVLRPLFVGRSVSLHPLALLLTVAAGALIWGVAGAFLAVPLTLLVTIMARELIEAERETTRHP